MAARAPLGTAFPYLVSTIAAIVVIGVATAGGACTCSKASDPAAADGASSTTRADEDAVGAAREAGEVREPGGLSAPIAAARSENGDVVVAGLDVPAKAIRIQRISAKDEVLTDRTIFADLKWSSESELKMAPAGGGVAVTWRGLRGGKLVRQLLLLGSDLAPKGEPTDVAAASCASHDAIWYTDGKRVHARPWSGKPTRIELPKDKDAALVCGAHRAFALIDDDDGTSVILLGGSGTSDGGASDAGAGASAGAGAGSSPVSLFEEKQFGDDDQRERAEYTSGDDLGVVRLATSGALTLREVRAGAPGPIHKLKTAIPRDDDVVATDASAKIVIIVFTEDVGEKCVAEGGATTASTRVKALRIDRGTFEESIVELSPGGCGREIGPFFTSAVGDAVSVAWVERIPVAGKSRAPIAGLGYRRVPATGPATELARIEQPADALVDAGCDGTRCFAVALARRSGMDAMVPGLARVLRY